MIHPIFNREEKRFRSGIRIPFFFLGMILLVGLTIHSYGRLAMVSRDPLCVRVVSVEFIFDRSSVSKEKPWFDGGLSLERNLI